MNDFVKHKIAFAVAFLAVLFSISPLLKDFGGYGFYIFDLFLSINSLYLTVSIVFSLSVYAFGIQFLSEKGIGLASLVGNFLYALALIIPAAYSALAVSIFIINASEKYIGNFSIEHISSTISIILAIYSSSVTFKLKDRLVKKEKDSVSDQLSKEETLFMRRAQELMRIKSYDLAIVEAFKAIEVSARKALIDKGLYFYPGKWVSEIQKNKLLPHDLINGLNEIRQARNIAAHGLEPLSAETAKAMMPIASRIVATLSSQQYIT